MNVEVPFVLERVLPETEQSHDPIVILFGPLQITDRKVEMVDADDFNGHLNALSRHEIRGKKECCPQTTQIFFSVICVVCGYSSEYYRRGIPPSQSL